ncbi:hypothetical protein DERP_001735 [Dermatophagoides pteronyssinus]|uniref:Uncharacterized protein n=1 Tax=Dermatophagoides pteronyssinus TaxID=6956 RepID=A0ABQ8JBB8_DERPT|nr:hypothetical protein DERP_001735 [Dermatophagoides pteronyssinus]
MDNDLHEKQIIKDIFQCEIKESSQTIQKKGRGQISYNNCPFMKFGQHIICQSINNKKKGEEIG